MVYAVKRHLSALKGLAATWLVLAAITAFAYDASDGVPMGTLAFLISLGAFSLVEGVRYSRAWQHERMNMHRSDDDDHDDQDP